MRAGIVTGLVLVVGAIGGGKSLEGQTAWPERTALAGQYRVAAIERRRFGHDEYWRAIQPLISAPVFTVADVGRSIQGRALRTVSFGRGPVTVFLWSQMHGDEATATMALADVFAFVAATDRHPMRDAILERLTVTVLPLLNPDGAELFQRENAVGIDINRDARRLASPEARALKAVHDRLRPTFGFNLHDQNARTRAGNGAQAAIALLPPPADASGRYGPVRSRARLVAAWLAADFANAVPGRIAKYDDSFNPRAFGDLMQAWGTSTVLIESGALAGDPDKQQLRTINAAAILGVLEAIALRSYRRVSPARYQSLPFNRSGAYDLLIQGGSVVLAGAEPIRADLAINFDDPLARTGGRVREVGDLEMAVALDTVRLTGRYLHPAPENAPVRDGSGLLRIGAPARFVIKATADSSSPEIGQVP